MIYSVDGVSHYTVRLKENDDVVGHLFIVREADDTYNVGLCIDAGTRGRGYATEAMAGAITWFENSFGKQSLGCMIEFGNLASDKVARKLGFKIMREIEPDEDNSAHLVLYKREP